MNLILLISITIAIIITFDYIWNIFINNNFPTITDFMKDICIVGIIFTIIYYSSYVVTDGLLIPLTK